MHQTSNRAILRILSAPLLVALVAALALSAPAIGAGGVSPSGPSEEPKAASGGGDSNLAPGNLVRRWDRASSADKRWARSTSECESGHDPNALGLGGRYRGAFQFTRDAWRIPAPSPGGDPIDYSWKSQAAVALALRAELGENPWPVCG